jgi:hypothetical protein
MIVRLELSNRRDKASAALVVLTSTPFCWDPSSIDGEREIWVFLLKEVSEAGVGVSTDFLLLGGPLSRWAIAVIIVAVIY